jgi:hypothetical protein
MTVTESLGRALLGRTSRRGFLARATVTATALSVGPVDLLIRPGTAYAQICTCAPGYDCDCSDLCCDGYTQFCCTINGGRNACPPGTFAGGWWKADGSEYCAGPRYYIDCQGECSCGCSEGTFCPGCDGLDCECALGDCANRHVGCTEFRYGQCNQQIACSGRIACRVVSCIPPWIIDSTCTTTVQVDDSTADHYAPCQDGPMFNGPIFAGMAANPQGSGYWLCDNNGLIYTYGQVENYGTMLGTVLAAPVVGMAATQSGHGYWMAAADGGVFAFGDAPFYGSMGEKPLAAPIVGIAADPATGGYRLVGADGGVFDFNADFEGTMATQPLAKPAVGIAATNNGLGYWLAGADAGVFTFGEADFYGCYANHQLAAPIVGIAPTPTDKGYWLVGADGGIFTFGDAGFYGTPATAPLLAPVVAMAPTPTGQGYWLVDESGRVYPYGNAGNFGGYTQ